MDQMTKKSLNMHKALHSIDNIDGMHESRKEGRRECIKIEDCLDASIPGIEEFIKKSKKGLIIVANDSSVNISTN